MDDLVQLRLPSRMHAFLIRKSTSGGLAIQAPVASGGLLASQECRRVGARSSPRPDGVWGEKNAPVVSHHGYVRARRTSPAWTPV